MAPLENPLQRRSRLDVVAAPVDTFVRPASPQKSRLWDVADGLSRLDTGLSSFLAERKKKQADGDELRGRAAFYKSNATGFAEGVRDGSIPAWASEDFKRGYKNAEGEGQAARFEQDFLSAYTSWADKANPDPAAFDRFFHDYARNYIQTDDPEVLRGLLPGMRAAAERVRQQNSTDLATLSYKAGLDANVGSASQQVDAASEDGLRRPEGVDYESLWANTMKMRDRAVGTGMRAEDFDTEMFKMFADKAVEKGDHQLLEMLDRVVPGTAVRYSDTPAGRNLKEATIERLTTLANQRETDNLQKQKAEDKERYNKNFSNTLRVLSEDPNSEVPEDVIADMSKHDPDVRTKIAAARKTLAEEKGGVENPAAIRQVYEEIITGKGDKRTIMEHLAAGTIKNPETIGKLLKFADDYGANGGDTAAILSSQSARQVLTAIGQRTAAPDSFFSLGSDGTMAGVTDTGFQASLDYKRALLEWAVKNPNATEVEKMEAASSIGATILKSISAGPDGAQYVPPKGTTDNPFTPPTATTPSGDKQQQQGDGQQGTTPEGQPATDGWERVQVEPTSPIAKLFGGDAPPDISLLSAERRTKLEQEAKRIGVPVNELLKTIWKRIKSKISPAQSPEAASFAPQGEQPDGGGAANSNGLDGGAVQDLLEQAGAGEQVGSLVDQTLEAAGATTGSLGTAGDALGAGADQAGASDLQATAGVKGMLGKIMKGEASSYNTIFGGKQIPLSDMTVAEVLKFQQDWKSRGTKSTAVGGYQFIHQTLSRLVKKYNIPLDARFDPNLQDQLAMKLMEERGLGKFLAGKMDVRTFANNLAKEWASLPAALGKKAGKSYYAGDGLNKSSHSLDDIIASLDVMKMQKTGEAAPAAPAAPPKDMSKRSIVAFSRSGDIVSAKEFLGGKLVGKPREHIDGMHDDTVKGLTSMFEAAPEWVQKGLGIMSGTRTIERQKELWKAALKKYGSPAKARKWVAPPGNSMHNHGLAADLSWNGQKISHKNTPKEVIKWLHANASRFGMAFPLGNEEWHIEPVGARGGASKKRLA